MDQYFISLLIHAGIGAIMQTIKNPTSHNAVLLKSALLSLADSIYEAYGVTHGTATPQDTGAGT